MPLRSGHADTQPTAGRQSKRLHDLKQAQGHTRLWFNARGQPLDKDFPRTGCHVTKEPSHVEEQAHALPTAWQVRNLHFSLFHTILLQNVMYSCRTICRCRDGYSVSPKAGQNPLVGHLPSEKYLKNTGHPPDNLVDVFLLCWPVWELAAISTHHSICMVGSLIGTVVIQTLTRSPGHSDCWLYNTA